MVSDKLHNGSIMCLYKDKNQLSVITGTGPKKPEDRLMVYDLDDLGNCLYTKNVKKMTNAIWSFCNDKYVRIHQKVDIFCSHFMFSKSSILIHYLCNMHFHWV